MKVLYFTRDYTTHDYRFLSALSAAGHTAFFLRLEDDGFLYESRPLPPDVVVVPWAGGRRRAADLDTWMGLMPALRQVIADIQPNLIHAGPVPSCGFMAALTGFHPLLVMSWGSDVLVDADSSPLLKSTAAVALRAADALVCDCNAVRSGAKELGGPDDDHIVQFPWGVDLELFRPAPDRQAVRQQLGLGDEGQFVVVSTRLWEPVYGIETLVEAVRQARLLAPQIRLVLLGDGSLRERVRESIAAAGLENAVHMPGQVPNRDLVRYFQAADLYLSCATSDGSSISLLEAMACALPVVVSDTPGNREWVTHADAGALVPVGDVAGFTAAVAHFALSPAGTLRLAGQINRQVAEARADWNVNVNALFEIYERLTSAGAVPRVAQNLTGVRYQLEPLELRHISDAYIGWLNEPEVNQFLEVRFAHQTRESVTAFVQSFQGVQEKYAWAVCERDRPGVLLGTCTLYDINRRHQTAHFGVMIGDRGHWGGGCSTEAIDLLLEHAFEALALRRVTGNCYGSNRGMAFAFRRIGFVREGTMRQAYVTAPGECVDGYYWGILADEWRAKRAARTEKARV